MQWTITLFITAEHFGDFPSQRDLPPTYDDVVRNPTPVSGVGYVNTVGIKINGKALIGESHFLVKHLTQDIITG